MPIRPMKNDIIKSNPAIISAISRLFWIVDPTLRLPMNFGTKVPPSKPSEKIIPKIVP